jgi:hypothetical protein
VAGICIPRAVRGAGIVAGYEGHGRVGARSI